MQMRYEIPDDFWSLFRSVNRDIYIDSLLAINEEYQYNNYFLTQEACIRILSYRNEQRRFKLQREEDETETDALETPASRMLALLLKKGWLKKIEDYNTFVTNIAIPDYAAAFIDAFERLTSNDSEETEVYIQNVYATLFSFKSDPRMNLSMLRAALKNTRLLNKAIQDMLHNMDRFFARLLEKESYGELLKEHLEGYVEGIVRKKYHILKTSDNFYIYKTDIKKVLRDMREDDAWIETIRQRAAARGDTKEDVLDILEMIDRGFDDIEAKIENMDREHTKYVRATVTRLNYLLNNETDSLGLVARLLNRMAQEDSDEMTKAAAAKMNLSLLSIASEKSLYKRRKGRADFISLMAADEEHEDLAKDAVLKLNKVRMRFGRGQIEEFIEAHMTGEVMDTGSIELSNDDDFEKLILAYDLSTRKNSRYMVIEDNGEMISNGRYSYPSMKFIRKR